MRKFQALFLLFFLIGHLHAQDILKVGDKAPAIVITDYLLNAPEDKNIQNKYIVLEFWATWCAPCLGAVPHLNALQTKFKNRKDLIFLSLTYEKPEKTKKTLEKVDFQTIVVSDQTKKTETNFNVKGIPHTVVIDNKGIIRWIGVPLELNETLLEDLLAGKAMGATGTEEISTSENTTKTAQNAPESIVTVAMQFLKDPNTQYFFSLIHAQDNDPEMAIDALFKGKYLQLNKNIQSILSEIIKKPEIQIVVTENLAKNRYNLIYRNSNTIESGTHTEIIKYNLLKSLNLTESTETKTVEVYKLQVADANKLGISANQQGESHNGDNDTHFIFAISKIETLVKKIGGHQKIIIFDETELTNNLDFILRKGTLDELMTDLDEYGLTLKKGSKEIEFFNFK